MKQFRGLVYPDLAFLSWLIMQKGGILMIVEYGLDKNIIVVIGFVILVLGLLYLGLTLRKPIRKWWRKRHSQFMALEEYEELGAYKCPKCKRIISVYDMEFEKIPVKTGRFMYELQTGFCPHCGQKVINKVVKSFWV